MSSHGNIESIFVVLVVLEGLQKLVVFGERLVASRLRHVVRPVRQFLSPKCHALLPLVSNIRVNQFAQLLVVGNLASLLEPQGFSEIIVYVLDWDWYSVLVVHDQPTHPVLIERLRREGRFAGGLKLPLPRVLLSLLFLLVNAQLNFFQVLNGLMLTSCSKSWCFLPVLANVSALLRPFP